MPRSDGGTQITIRIHPSIIERADDLVDFVGERTNNASPARSDVWREAMLRGLADLEREKAETKKRKR